MITKINDFDINLHDALSKRLEHKRILYIPIYSMRSYETGLYDVSCDGNVNRFISKFSKINYKSLTITYPEKTENEYFIRCFLRRVDLIKCEAYGINALATRKNEEGWFKFLHKLDRSKYDVVLFEPNVIGKYQFEDRIKVMYWMPVSSTINNRVEFLKEFYDLDLINTLKYETFVCSKNQKELYTTAHIDNDVFANSIFIDEETIYPYDSSYHYEKNIIFNPFRQSDKGYKIKELYTALEAIDKSKYIVLYSAPNGFDVQTSIPRMRVKTDRKIYYNILKSRPIIVYLENPDEILHTSIFEFMYFNCRLIYLKNDLFKHHKRIGEMKSINDLESTLGGMLNG